MLLRKLERLLYAAKEWLAAYRKRQAERASTIPPAPAMPHHRHNFSFYSNWAPGRELFDRLKIRECVYCSEPETERNRLMRCPFFG